mmetsp:Transcript_36887/g.91141  ORF Transcript_36887/g.91141 Transcript_36887/m.91141 type:complete len:204 (-) Transcript_36887:133-744(-)
MAPRALGRDTRRLRATLSSRRFTRPVASPSGRSADTPSWFPDRSRLTSCTQRAREAGSPTSWQSGADSSARRAHSPRAPGSARIARLPPHISCASVCHGSICGSAVSWLLDTSRERRGRLARASPGNFVRRLWPMSSFSSAVSTATSSGNTAIWLCDTMSVVRSRTSHQLGLSPLPPASKLTLSMAWRRRTTEAWLSCSPAPA